MRLDKRPSERLETYEQEKEKETKRYQSELNDLKALIIGSSLNKQDKTELLLEFSKQLIDFSLKTF